VIVLSAEEYPTYAPNCMENVIRDDILPEALFYKGGERFYEEHRVDFRAGKEVVRIDNRRKVVITSEGEEIGYDRCLLAAGAYAFVPPIEGIELGGVTTAKTLRDALQIREWIESGRVKRAVVVGAGPIGIEDAETLHHLGIEVSVVEVFDRVLPKMLDHQMGRIYGDTLSKETGISIYLEHQVLSFHGNNWVEAVEVKPRGSDRSFLIEADMVIISTGVRPRTSLIEGTDIEIHMDKKLGRPIGGILVNEYQQTSDPDVFAAGDISSGIDVWGNHRWIALFPTAQQSGYIAGLNLAGKKVKNPGLVDYNAVKTRTVTAGSGGLFEDAEEEFTVESGNYLIKVFLLEGKVRGYQFLGIPRGKSLNPENRLLGAMRSKIRTWEEKVLSDRGFGLEASGVLFHFFLKLHRELREPTRRAMENMLIRALANPVLDLPLYC
jgi:NADH-dependent fumarate reductase subunit D